MSSAATSDRIDEFRAAVRQESTAVQLQEASAGTYLIDGLAPRVVVSPANVEQLQNVLSEAHNSGVSVVPVGGGTDLGAGNVPESYDAAISLRLMDRIVAYEPADLTVTVDPGVRLAELQRTLAAQGQFLPLDPACDAAATIGGVLSVNAYGPLRHGFGTARDWVIGTRVVHADGSLSKSGGRVVKNVAGYDMHKLYIGAVGTLGVIAECTLKLAPLPQAEAVVAIRCRSAAEGAAIVLGAHDSGLAMLAAELLSPPAATAVLGEATWSVLVRLGGVGGAVQRSIREISAACVAAGVGYEVRQSNVDWDVWRAEFRPRDLALRVSVMPSRVGDAIEMLDRQLAGAAALLSATVTTGLIRANLAPNGDASAGALVEAAREVALRCVGALVVDAAPPELKRGMDVFGPPRSDFAIMRRLKQEFDPQRILSPGRFAGRL